MAIKYDRYGNATWCFYRKAYRKARWKRLGSRCLKAMLNYQEEQRMAGKQLDGGLIIVI